MRREPKGYGTRRHVEGRDIAGQSAVLVDDVVRTGSQMLHAASIIEGMNSTVTTALCILDRQLGGDIRLGRQRISLKALLTAADADELDPYFPAATAASL